MTGKNPKTYYIKTFGCQANTADSNTMSGILEALGFECVENKKSFETAGETAVLSEVLPKSDLFIINTCSVRQKSEDKVYGIAKILNDLFGTSGKRPYVIMAGCMVGSVTGDRIRLKPEELKNKTTWVDAYMDSSELYRLPEILWQGSVLSEWALQKFSPTRIYTKPVSEQHAYINISNGCDNFCSYCVVPYSRGKEISKPEAVILKEVGHLVSRGVSDITLCGQNVNSWGLARGVKFKIRTGSRQKLPFAGLLRKLHEFEELKNISFISSNPFDFTEDLIKTLKLPKISDYLHIAVQSGNNEILRKMNRRHTIEDFITLIDKIKKANPSVKIGTDIIVGFPGETESQFMDTVKLFEKIRFQVAFISMYSPRKGTEAVRLFADDISRKEKKRRHAFLTEVWKNTLKD